MGFSSSAAASSSKLVARLKEEQEHVAKLQRAVKGWQNKASKHELFAHGYRPR